VTSRTAIGRTVVAASALVAALAASSATVGAAPPAPSGAASCAATVTVTETRIAPGFVGDEVRHIVSFGPDALPSVVGALASAHLGDPEACAALIGE
jgi:hypothetical protein